jgi:hypothetical protein
MGEEEQRVQENVTWEPKGDWEKFNFGDWVRLKVNMNSNDMPWDFGVITKVIDEYPLVELEINTNIGLTIREYANAVEHMQNYIG